MLPGSLTLRGLVFHAGFAHALLTHFGLRALTLLHLTVRLALLHLLGRRALLTGLLLLRGGVSCCGGGREGRGCYRPNPCSSHDLLQSIVTRANLPRKPPENR